MSAHPVFVQSLPVHEPDPAVEGAIVDLEGEPFYRISNVDAMEPFFMSVVSASDHWLFISSRGALSAGRRNADFALFPYYAEDRIHDDAGQTGSRTVLRVVDGERRLLWEPFAVGGPALYRTTRNLYKHIHGYALVFEEVNHDLGLVFRYRWAASNRFGFERRSTLENVGDAPVQAEVLDGIQNLLPWGLPEAFQRQFSVLGDAYKDNQLDEATGLATYALSSIPGDSPEPAEALRATVCWSTAGPDALRLLSSGQLDAFRRGHDLHPETRVLGRRGAYFVNDALALAPGEAREWSIVTDLGYGASEVAELKALLADRDARRDALAEDVAASGEALTRIVAGADGLQSTRDRVGSVHHFANVLFNVMRGGTFESGYRISMPDLADFIWAFNHGVWDRHGEFIAGLGESFELGHLLEQVEAHGDPDLIRLVSEYLPISFSRRHGDPSRPWNRFSIELRDRDGRRKLAFEGNWRDIFQNWEALCLSFPEYFEGVIAKFVNTTTADGYNPYRVTKDGFDWEFPAPHEPWAALGYWSDHQLNYLIKLLEWSRAHHPHRLGRLLRDTRFVYAEVPYDLKPYWDMLGDPRRTIDFNWGRQEAIQGRVEHVGFDGRYLPGPHGGPARANLTEKLLVPFLAKIGAFVPEAGIWLNTQRPEWNDANNALAGYGASMVTVGFARRYATFCHELFQELGSEDWVEMSAEVAGWLERTHGVLQEHEHLIEGGAPLSDADRKRVLDGLGMAASDYRTHLYHHGLSGERSWVDPARIREFLERVVRYLDHTIARNRREDGLYDAYNVLRIADDGIGVRRLYEMLEGQVAMLSSGALSPGQAVDLLAALRESAMYREDQHSYILYPERKLPGFQDKNRIPPDQVERSELLGRLLEAGDRRLVERDVEGDVHFNPDFRSVRDVWAALDGLRGDGWGELVDREGWIVAQIFESVFDHEQFTGRSGTFYGYEGLGSIYWHQVGKLLVAAQEAALQAAETDPETFPELARRYYDIRSGLGFEKSPDVYGAFPTDPYSHTPARAGAKQPGMTGQVKEEILTRLGELGVRIRGGAVGFDPVLLRRSEFFQKPQTFEYWDVRGERREMALEPGTLVFTYCQVPVVYRALEPEAGEARPGITLHLDDGSTRAVEGLALDAETSSHLFRRTGHITRMEVTLRPGLEG